MADKQGSRDVSLGPYRSTELALEERLSKEESCKILQLIQEENLGLTKYYSRSFSKKETAKMLSALGYQERKPGLFVTHEGEFVYITKSPWTADGTLVSGYTEGNLENILSEMQLFEAIGRYSEKLIPENVKSQKFSIALGISSLAIAIPILFIETIYPVYIVTGLMCSMVSGAMSGILIEAYENRINSRKFRLFMQKGALNLSRNANNYQFGKTVYEKILSQYELIKPKELETSELKQLPEMENKE